MEERIVFEGFDKIESLSICDKVTDIPFWAFEEYKELKSVYIPKSVVSIGLFLFKNCCLIENIEVAKDNKKYTSISGTLYDKKVKVLMQYAVGKKDKTFVVPEGVEKITDSAFENAINLSKVVLPKKLNRIGRNAFCNCKSLNKVEFLGSVKEWQNIKKGYGYKTNILAGFVKCTDGECEI